MWCVLTYLKMRRVVLGALVLLNTAIEEIWNGPLLV